MRGFGFSDGLDFSVCLNAVILKGFIFAEGFHPVYLHNHKDNEACDRGYLRST